MRFTLGVTQRCNLACGYCLMGKRRATMAPSSGRGVVDWIFDCAPASEKVEIYFSGGEPLLELPTLEVLADIIERHPAFDRSRVSLTVVSNGTVFTQEIAKFLREHDIHYALGCDGPPDVQDRFRRFDDGRGSSKAFERTARVALELFESVPVTTVFRPETLRSLPDTVAYLANLRLGQIHLTPDLSARWSIDDTEAVQDVYTAVAGRWVESHLAGSPLFVSLLDDKIALMRRGGYQEDDRCRMGDGGFSFTPDGRVLPCSRLFGCGSGAGHRITDVARDLVANRCQYVTRRATPAACRDCDLRNYCTNWCGSANYLSSGDPDQVGAFLCASERTSFEVAGRAYDSLEQSLGAKFTRGLRD